MNHQVIKNNDEVSMVDQCNFNFFLTLGNKHEVRQGSPRRGEIQGVSLREIPNMRSDRGSPWRGEILFLPV